MLDEIFVYMLVVEGACQLHIGAANDRVVRFEAAPIPCDVGSCCVLRTVSLRTMSLTRISLILSRSCVLILPDKTSFVRSELRSSVHVHD